MNQINMTTIKKEFATMREFKQRVDALNFVIGMWKLEIEDVIHSPDFKELSREELEELIMPNALAIRFWKTQLDDFVDRTMATWKNRAGKATSAMMKLTLEEAIEEYSYFPEGSEKLIIPEAVISEAVVPEVEETKEIEATVKEDDALLQSMIEGN